ncbi:probable mannose-1-phosphate guanylyltransferase 2 [Magnolia sinica]|uniref:probable mannose-1-phosphate guanylyltransferase 2 n=1 Tax=Magnolia sinica TaxID=86752 RepID=UPI00265981B7|nr:probable mannose-1-phosphate guanylyltransferase 2 [Magnolia sinica]
MAASRKALILVTGHTIERPRPTVDQSHVLGGIDDKPMLLHQIEQLRSLVSEIILAVDFLEEPMKKQLENLERAFGVKITICESRDAYGSGGWLAVAKQRGLLAVDGDGPFFLLRSDIICHYPLTKMITFHEFHKREATMVIKWEASLSDQEDVVIIDDKTGMVREFTGHLGDVQSFDPETGMFYCIKGDHYRTSDSGGYVIAGIYLLNPSVVDKAQLRLMSFEEEILPTLALEGNLYALHSEGLHFNLQNRGFDGALNAYRGGTLHMSGNPRLWVDERSYVAPSVIMEPNCRVDEYANVSNSILMNGVQVQRGAKVQQSIIGQRSIVGEGAIIIDMSVIGEEVEVHRQSDLVGAVVLGNGRKVGWLGTEIKHAISMPPDVDLGASTSGSSPPESP